MKIKLSSEFDGSPYIPYKKSSSAPRKNSTFRKIIPDDILPILLDQQDTARTALDTLNRIHDKESIIATALRFPELIDEDVAPDAIVHKEDLSSAWRSRTDEISFTIAKNLPERELGNIVLTETFFYTSNKRLYARDSEGISIYYSLPDLTVAGQEVQKASVEQWHDFLFRLTMI